MKPIGNLWHGKYNEKPEGFNQPRIMKPKMSITSPFQEDSLPTQYFRGTYDTLWTDGMLEQL